MPVDQDRPEIKDPWKIAISEITNKMEVIPEKGLSSQTVNERLEQFGKNELRKAEHKSAWNILVEQFKSWIILLLVVAAGLSFIFGDLVEGFAISVVIVINAAIGFATEIRAVRSMEALQKLSRVESKVRRNREIEQIDAEMIVPGDILILESGDMVTADARIIEANKLQTNESALTGESTPVTKSTGSIQEDVQVAERKNMVFKGTNITRGSGEAIVISTGMQTELGRISTLVKEAKEEVTPLEERLDQLGTRLIWVTLGIATLVVVTGYISGKDLLLMIETSIALAVASIPEGLPIVATIALARGMWRMARRNALINRLSSVETLGATNVILTDKTGTLTENKMTLNKIILSHGEVDVTGKGLSIEGKFTQGEKEISLDDQNHQLLKQTLMISVLCNNGSLKEENGEVKEGIGDPTEVALLVAGKKAGFTYDDLVKKLPEEREEAFDPEIKMMATFHKKDNQYLVAVKGAAESVLQVCKVIQTQNGEEELTQKTRQEWIEKSNQLAKKGLRVLMVAQKMSDSVDVDPYENLKLLGMLALLDPPRLEVRDSIKSCQQAGIRVVMVTGDQAATAQNIADQVGLYQNGQSGSINGNEISKTDQLGDEEREKLLKTPVFARVSPEQKLDLIALHQENNAIVAMTGDGVNDAPALKKADIGVAMGKRGTQVAKEASDMVLKDDAFASIVAAIEQGRSIFDNIRKFVVYLISCNVSEIMVIALASLVNSPLPIKPLQILYLNLVTDVFPALALGVSRGEKDIMEREPRDPKEPILTLPHWLTIGSYGILITAAVLGVFAWALLEMKVSTERAVTISFLTLAFAQLWHVFNMHGKHGSSFKNEIVQNRYVWGAVLLCVILLLVAIYIPVLADVLSLTAPETVEWILILGASLFPAIVGEVAKKLFPKWFFQF